MKKGINYISVYSGIIAPIVFVLIFTIEGLFRENYSATKNFISELSIGDRGWIQIANFLIFGFLFFVFNVGLMQEFRKRGLSLTGPILFLILASCYFFSGPFVTDPGTIFTQQKSVHGIIHGVLGAMVFLLMTVSSWTFLKLFKKEKEFKSLKNVTLFFATILTLSLIVFTYATKVPSSENIFPNMNGFFQRLALIPFMVWLCYFAFSIRNVLTKYDTNN
ncbi:hypothetical protein MASR2M117_25160 [Paludibacter sp.]